MAIPEFREAVGYIRNMVQGGELEFLTAVLFEATVEEASIDSRDGTASNIEGPFYVAGAPMLYGATPALPMRTDEAGRHLTFSGTVSLHGRPPARLRAGRRLAGDDAGLYSQFAPEIPDWNLRGVPGAERLDRACTFDFVLAPADSGETTRDATGLGTTQRPTVTTACPSRFETEVRKDNQ